MPSLPTRLISLSILALALSVAGSASEPAVSEAEPGEDRERAVAIFAGGCFWCMEPPFDELEGVESTTSGYIGGDLENPSYEQVSSGGTGHAEAVKIIYDPDRVSYQDLLEVFWRNIDPLAEDRQFCDQGSQYRSAIFYLDERQQALAAESRRRLEESGRFDAPIVTGIEAAGEFYAAEAYHQDYYRKKPLRYKFYRYGCGRDQRLEALWGEQAGG